MSDGGGHSDAIMAVLSDYLAERGLTFKDVFLPRSPRPPITFAELSKVDVEEDDTVAYRYRSTMTTPPMVADRIVIRPAAYELMAAHLAHVAEHADWQHACLACQLWATLENRPLTAGADSGAGVHAPTVAAALPTVNPSPTIGS